MGEIETVEAEKMGWLDLPRGASYPTFPYRVHLRILRIKSSFYEPVPGRGQFYDPSGFLHSCLDNCSATFLKILGPGHLRSGHQVRSSDHRLDQVTKPPKKKTFQSRHGHSGGDTDLKLSGFSILPSRYLQLVYLGFFYIGDLSSGQFRDLPTRSLGQTYKSMGKNSSKSNTYQICSKRTEP